jgi:hypothetical protein
VIAICLVVVHLGGAITDRVFVDEITQRGIQVCRFFPGGRWGAGEHISVSETEGGVGGSFSTEQSSLEEGPGQRRWRAEMKGLGITPS